MMFWDLIGALLLIGTLVHLVVLAMELKDPYAKDYEATKSDVRERQATYAELAHNRPSEKEYSAVEHLLGKENSLHLSAVDMFVQIAQETLLRRKRIMHVCCLGCGVLFLMLVTWFASVSGALKFIKDVVFNAQYFKDTIDDIVKMNWPAAFYVIARNGSAIAIYLFVLYVLASLFRAFLHEATILENRIHSIRLGRLYYYTKFLSARSAFDIKTVSSQLNADDFEKIFGWNIETSTAFKDINPELVNRGVFSQIAAAVSGVGKSR